jgi:glycosyltransferase involved in cell wall biosynthesis
MRVVFLDTTMDGTLFGGAHTFLHKIFEGLNQKGIEVHFITKGTPIAKTAVNIENAGAIFHNKIWKKSSLVEDAAPILADWLNKLKPDVYVVSVSPDIGWVVLPYLSPSIATIAIGHNDINAFYEPAKHYSQFLTKVVGVSDEICKNYINKSDIRKEDVKWIPYGVETSETGPLLQEKKTLSLVYSGRLEDTQKRASDIIRIILLLRKEKIDFNFKIIGDGPLLLKFKDELSSEIKEGIVELTGWLKGGEVIKHLRSADVFILTSAFEGFCISLVEAMANCCCPVVTDIASGNKELVKNDENGFVLPIGDVEGFVKKIKYLSLNPEKLYELRKKSWSIGKMFSVDRMVNSYLDYFEEARSEVLNNTRNSDPDFPLMKSCQSPYPLWLRRLKKIILN